MYSGPTEFWGSEELTTALCVEVLARYRRLTMAPSSPGPLPRTVVAWMLGIELGRLDDIRRWSAAIMGAGDDSVSDRERRAYFDEACECRTFLMHHLDQLARKPRGEHLAPFLTGTEDDDGLSVSEQVNVAMFLMAAGAETTTLLIGNSMLVLLEDPPCLRRLRADARLIPAFIEEVLRYESPAQRTKRVTKRPAEIAGIRIPQGALVELLIGSANRDPDKFADADQFRIDRQPIPHITFGQGPHACPGAQLARLEAAIVLETLVQRLPEVRRANPQEPVEFNRAISARGPARLDLVFPSQSDAGA